MCRYMPTTGKWESQGIPFPSQAQLEPLRGTYLEGHGCSDANVWSPVFLVAIFNENWAKKEAPFSMACNHAHSDFNSECCLDSDPSMFFVTFHSLVLTLCLAVAFGFMRFLFTLPSQNIIKCMCTVPYFSFFISRGQESGVWPVYFALPSSHASRVQEICSWCGISTLSVLVKSILRVWTPYSPFSFCWTTMSDCFELMFIFLLSPPFFMWRSYILSFCNCCDPSLLRFYSTGFLSIGSNYFDLLKAAERWIMAEGTVKVIFEPFLAPICVWARARDKCHDHSDRCSRYSSLLEMDIL